MSLLDTVVDQATWAFHAGWGRSGQGLDAPRGRALDPRDRGDDTVGRPGEVDLEVGDGKARAAYQATCRLLGVGVYSNPSVLVRAARGAEVDPTELRRVAYLLEKAVGPPLPARPDPWCKVCRERAAGPHHAGRCSTCARQFHKTGVDTKPTKEIITPWSAKAKREKHNQGWGSG